MAEMTEDQRKALEEKIKSMSPEELKEFQKKQCIFCRMVAGEIPSKKVYEDDKVFAILDINPASAGHVLLLPKDHYPILQQMPDDLVAHLGLISKGFSQAFLQVLKVEGSTIFAASGASAGQRAQHVMLHLIPRKENDGIGINPPSRPMQPQDLQKVCQALKPFADQIMGVKKDDQKREAPQAPAPSEQGEAPAAQPTQPATAKPTGSVGPITPSSLPKRVAPSSIIIPKGMEVSQRSRSLEGHVFPGSEDVVVVKASPGPRKRKKPIKKAQGQEPSEDRSGKPRQEKEAGSSLDDITSFLTRR